MTYYEELGLSPKSGAREIQRAYKAIARQLHPDRFRDDAGRRAADAQMKRLNGIYAVLSDAGKRKEYDASLAAPPPPVRPEPAPGWMAIRDPGRPPRVGAPPRTYAVWAGAATVAAGFLLVLLRQDPAPPEARAAPPAIPAAEAAAAVETRKKRGSETARLESIITELKGRVRRLEQERGYTDARPVAAPAAELDETPPGVAPLRPEPPPFATPDVPPPPGDRGLAGRWYYPAPRKPAQTAQMYPPEYIEAVITERDGVLKGRYYARYRVADRAVSGEVVFEFAGRPPPPRAALPWTGPGGSRGEVWLRLVGENALEVAWAATEMGRHLALGSGSSVLLRQQTSP